MARGDQLASERSSASKDAPRRLAAHDQSGGLCTFRFVASTAS